MFSIPNLLILKCVNEVFHFNVLCFPRIKCERGVKGQQPKDHKRVDIFLKYSNLVSFGFCCQIDLAS